VDIGLVDLKNIKLQHIKLNYLLVILILLTDIKMRDKRFITEHRGGSLKKEQHKQLIKWARDCVEHILPLLGEKLDERLENAILIAKEWEKGKATVGEAMKASVGAHSAARESSDPISISVARAVGHAVATAHMADHSIGGPLYALRAVKYADGSVDEEREWQKNKLNQLELPLEIVELVLITMTKKEKSLKI